MKKAIRVTLYALLLLGASVPALACIYCIPCGDGYEICAGGPSASCVCLRDGSCVGTRCPEISVLCCNQKFGSIHAEVSSLITPGMPHYRVTFSNGEQRTFYTEAKDPLKDFPFTLKSIKTGKQYLPVTAIKEGF